MLAFLGGAAGILFAFWADGLLMAAYLPSDSQGLKIATAPDLRILLFTIAVTMFTGLLFGLAPALQATKPDVAPTLKDQAGAVVGGGSSALRKALVAAQVTLSLLLLIGAGLFVKSLSNLRALGPGFPAERLIGFQIDPAMTGYTPERAKLFFQNLTESVGHAAGRALRGPGRGADSGGQRMGQLRDGGRIHAPARGRSSRAVHEFHQPELLRHHGRADCRRPRFYREGYRSKVLHSKGRPPRNEDFYVPATIMINETFAKKYFAGRNPIGRHIGMGIDPGTKLDMEIIGVVKDFKYTNLRDDIPEQAFEPYLAEQHTLSGMTVYLRTTMDPNQLFLRGARQGARTGFQRPDLRHAHDGRTDQQFARRRSD